MSNLVLRNVKNSPLTADELDANFTDLLVAIGGTNSAPYTVPTPTGTGSPVLSSGPSISALTITGHPTIEGVTSTGATGTGNLVFSASPTFTGTTNVSTLNVSTKEYIGTQANSTRFPNATVAVSSTAAGIQQNESHNIGLIAEGTANSSDVNIYGIGLYGVGYTAGATRSGGVVGEGHVSATGDTGSAIGVRGYANDTHAGGMNIGLYGDAANGSSSYSLYLNNGDIYSVGSKSWVLNGDLTFSGAYNVVAYDFNTTSDASLKENIEPILDGLSVINKLKPVSFDWKESGQKAYGLIAQEVEEVVPEIIHTSESNVKSIGYSQLISFLIKSVQQQESIIADLNQRIQLLENK